MLNLLLTETDATSTTKTGRPGVWAARSGAARITRTSSDAPTTEAGPVDSAVVGANAA